MVTRGIVRGLVLVIASFVLQTGCDGRTRTDNGGETNWLGTCETDADCGGAGTCLCGICTSACSDDSTCGGRTPAVCARRGSSTFVASCGTSGPASGVCVSRCPADGCSGARTCLDGACVPAPIRDGSIPMNGSGGAPPTTHPDAGSGNPEASAGDGDSGPPPRRVRRNPACPSQPPSAADTCSVPATCEYPNAAHPRCTTLAECPLYSGPTGRLWLVKPPAEGCGTAPVGCPSSFAARASGTSCPADAGALTCDYAEGRCECIHCGGADGSFDTMWACQSWDSTYNQNACGTPRPLVGDACETPDLGCGYYGCRVKTGPNMQCKSGYWTGNMATIVDCPLPACGSTG